MLSFLRSERGLRRVRPWDVVCRFTVQGSLLKQTSKNNFNESSQKTNHITTTISLLPIPLETLIDTPWHWSKTDLNKQNISPDFHVAGIIDCLSEEHSIVRTRLHDYNELTDLKTGIYRCVHNLNGPWKKRKRDAIKTRYLSSAASWEKCWPVAHLLFLSVKRTEPQTTSAARVNSKKIMNFTLDHLRTFEMCLMQWIPILELETAGLLKWWWLAIYRS